MRALTDAGARTSVFLAVIACAATFASCVDPIHDQQIQALGPESDGVPEGEFHRAGQPCGVCHQDSGPAKTTFTVAGTVFYGPTKLVGAVNVNVEMVDSLGSNFVAVTNCVGNFYVPPDVWNPAFPILVQLQGTDGNILKMKSQISRESGCAGCHKDPLGASSPGHVHLSNTEPANPFIDKTCPVGPELVNGAHVSKLGGAP